MSEHCARIVWENESDSLRYEDYNREHAWTFPKSGIVVKATAAPKYRGKPEAVDPEEALVAAISSCHMLTFLAICARRNVVVQRYDDEAVGWLEPNEQKRLAITRVVLKPKIIFAAGHRPDAETLAKIHEESHAHCFIANSVRTAIAVEGSAEEVAR